MCLLGILQPNCPSADTDLQIQSERSHSELRESLHKSGSETPKHSIMSLVDSGCFKSPSDEGLSVSIMDDFDALLLQLKCIGDTSRRPSVRDQRTVPYFPPVTSALRRELGMFDCPQSSCVEYADDEAVPSPQFLQMSSLDREYASSLADVNSTSATDLRPFQTLSKSCVQQFSAQSCPDVSDPSTTTALRASVANVQQWTSPNTGCFNG